MKLVVLQALVSAERLLAESRMTPVLNVLAPLIGQGLSIGDLLWVETGDSVSQARGTKIDVGSWALTVVILEHCFPQIIRCSG